MTPPPALTSKEREAAERFTSIPYGEEDRPLPTELFRAVDTLLARSDALEESWKRAAVVNDNWQREAAKIAKERDQFKEEVARLRAKCERNAGLQDDLIKFAANYSDSQRARAILVERVKALDELLLRACEYLPEAPCAQPPGSQKNCECDHCKGLEVLLSEIVKWDEERAAHLPSASPTPGERQEPVKGGEAEVSTEADPPSTTGQKKEGR